MKLNEWIKLMEEIAPIGLAMEYDNVGLLIGTKKDINRVLVALDLSVPVAEEASIVDADLVLTHHPVFFHPVNRILPDDPETAPAYMLIQKGIGMYAAHTNLDACEGGVNDALAETLELDHITSLEENGIGRIGLLKKPVLFSEFIDHCCEKLNTRVRFKGSVNKTVQKIGIVGGAGGDMVKTAFDKGCDVYLTGEMKHHEAVYASFYQLPIVEAGHYQTEAVVLKKLISRLQKYENGVEYIESSAETAPLMTR